MASFADCMECGRAMTPGGGCDITPVFTKPDLYPIPVGAIHDLLSPEGFCHDCNAGQGHIHHVGCDAEACPKCHLQLISCGCLEEAEKKANTSTLLEGDNSIDRAINYLRANVDDDEGVEAEIAESLSEFQRTLKDTLNVVRYALGQVAAEHHRSSDDKMGRPWDRGGYGFEAYEGVESLIKELDR